MSIEAMKQALEALNIIKSSCSEGRMAHAENEAAIAEYILRQAIAEAEKQAPVAWFIQYEYRHDFLWREPTSYEKNSALEIKPLYTAPPKREWVGLTDEERRSIQEWQRIQEELGPVWAPMMLYLYLAIEAKLKEKNA